MRIALSKIAFISSEVFRLTLVKMESTEKAKYL